MVQTTNYSLKMINSTLKTTLFVNVTVYSIVLAINRVLHIEHDPPFLSYLVHKNTLFNLLLDPFFQPFVLFIIYQLFIFFFIFHCIQLYPIISIYSNKVKAY